MKVPHFVMPQGKHVGQLERVPGVLFCMRVICIAQELEGKRSFPQYMVRGQRNKPDHTCTARPVRLAVHWL
jgi:hypothetical protein